MAQGRLERWQVRVAGASHWPLPVSVELAYELATANGQDGAYVLDHTRQLCGHLRLAAKGRHAPTHIAETLQELRQSLTRARELHLRRVAELEDAS